MNMGYESASYMEYRGCDDSLGSKKAERKKDSFWKVEKRCLFNINYTKPVRCNGKYNLLGVTWMNCGLEIYSTIASCGPIRLGVGFRTMLDAPLIWA